MSNRYEVGLVLLVLFILGLFVVSFNLITGDYSETDPNPFGDAFDEEVTAYYVVAVRSNCSEQGFVLYSRGGYNPNSNSYWFDFHPFEEKLGCNPACVVYADTNVTEINWRCTGLLPP